VLLQFCGFICLCVSMVYFASCVSCAFVCFLWVSCAFAALSARFWAYVRSSRSVRVACDFWGGLVVLCVSVVFASWVLCCACVVCFVFSCAFVCIRVLSPDSPEWRPTAVGTGEEGRSLKRQGKRTGGLDPGSSKTDPQKRNGSFLERYKEGSTLLAKKNKCSFLERYKEGSTLLAKKNKESKEAQANKTTESQRTTRPCMKITGYARVTEREERA
jgi:hypothetical protein